jgi:hypothetical protein
VFLNVSHAALICAFASSIVVALPNGGPEIVTVTVHSQMAGLRSRANLIRPMGWPSPRTV